MDEGGPLLASIGAQEPQQIEARRKRLARAVVLGVAAAFSLQLVFISIFGEPYPALMMPRFSWAGPPRDEPLYVSVPEIMFTYADSYRTLVTQRQLWSGVSAGHRGTLMENLLSPLEVRPPAVASPRKRAPPAGLFPGLHLAVAVRSTEAFRRALADWLRVRAATFYSAAPPVRCEVDWYLVNADGLLSGVEARALDRKLTGRFSIDLDASHAR